MGFEQQYGRSFALFCPAQAMPVPLFRFVLIPILRSIATQVRFKNKLTSFYIEPIGSKAPTFSTMAKSSTYEMHSAMSFSLVCPAQALPVPMFRYLRFIFVSEPIGSKVPTFASESKSSSYVKRSHNDLALLCPAQALPLPIFRLVFFLQNRTSWSQAADFCQ